MLLLARRGALLVRPKHNGELPPPREQRRVSDRVPAVGAVGHLVLEARGLALPRRQQTVRAQLKALAAFDEAVDSAFDEVDLVYRGYVDDPRNTDHAWIETSAFHIHLPESLVLPVRRQTADADERVAWITVDAEHDSRRVPRAPPAAPRAAVGATSRAATRTRN